MTVNGSMNGNVFKVFVEKCLLAQLWEGAVVVMDNLPAHKVKEIEPLIQSVGASVVYQSPYSPRRHSPALKRQERTRLTLIPSNFGGHN